MTFLHVGDGVKKSNNCVIAIHMYLGNNTFVAL